MIGPRTGTSRGSRCAGRCSAPSTSTARSSRRRRVHRGRCRSSSPSTAGARSGRGDGLDRRTRSLLNLGMLTALEPVARARRARARRADERLHRGGDPGDAAPGGRLLRDAGGAGGVPGRRAGARRGARLRDEAGHGQIGFVGLGHMGVPMTRAARRRRATRCAAYDVDPAARARRRAQPRWSRWPRRPAGRRRRRPDARRARRSSAQVVLDEGLLDALAPGALVVDMGSSDPSADARARRDGRRRAGSATSTRRSRAACVGAEAGTLTIMVGGTAEELGRVRAAVRRARRQGRPRRPGRRRPRAEGAEQPALGDQLPDHARGGARPARGSGSTRR